jgi:hypothetical protein
MFFSCQSLFCYRTAKQSVTSNQLKIVFLIKSTSFFNETGVWTQAFCYLIHTSRPVFFFFFLFFSGYFGDGISWTSCSGWPQIKILMVSASHIAKITGMSHHHLEIIKITWCVNLPSAFLVENVARGLQCVLKY